MKITFLIWRLILTIGLSGVVFGYETGVISSALLFIRQDFPVIDKDPVLQEWIVSITPVSGIFGALLAVFTNNVNGRKKSLVSSTLIYVIGVFIIIFSQAPIHFLLGRAFIGISIGIVSITAPVYIVEVCPPINITVPILLYLILSLLGQLVSFITTATLNKLHNPWKWMLGIGLIPSIIQLVLEIFIDESPFWKYSKNDWRGGRAILEKILIGVVEEDQIHIEILEIEAAFQANNVRYTGSDFLKKICKAWYKLRFAVSFNVLTQSTMSMFDVNAIMYYSSKVVEGAHLNSNGAVESFLFLFILAKFVGTLGAFFIILRYGKNKLLILSVCSVLFSMVMYWVLFQPLSITPKIDLDSQLVPSTVSCAPYILASNKSLWHCGNCLNVKCGFCPPEKHNYTTSGFCLASTINGSEYCKQRKGSFHHSGCSSSLGPLNVIFICIYMVIYSLGLGTIPWVVSVEQFPTEFRPLGGAIGYLINWIGAFLVRAFSKKIGDIVMVSTSGVMSILLVGVTHFFLPHTDGVRLEDIPLLLNPPVHQQEGQQEDELIRIAEEMSLNLPDNEEDVLLRHGAETQRNLEDLHRRVPQHRWTI